MILKKFICAALMSVGLPANACYLGMEGLGIDDSAESIANWSVATDVHGKKHLSYSGGANACTVELRTRQDGPVMPFFSLLGLQIDAAAKQIYHELTRAVEQQDALSSEVNYLGLHKTEEGLQIFAYQVLIGEDIEETLFEVYTPGATVVRGECSGPSEQTIAAVKLLSTPGAAEICPQ